MAQVTTAELLKRCEEVQDAYYADELGKRQLSDFIKGVQELCKQYEAACAVTKLHVDDGK